MRNEARPPFKTLGNHSGSSPHIESHGMAPTSNHWGHISSVSTGSPTQSLRFAWEKLMRQNANINQKQKEASTNENKTILFWFKETLFEFAQYIYYISRERERERKEGRMTEYYLIGFGSVFKNKLQTLLFLFLFFVKKKTPQSKNQFTKSLFISLTPRCSILVISTPISSWASRNAHSESCCCFKKTKKKQNKTKNNQ